MSNAKSEPAAAAVSDVAASLGMTSTSALFQVEAALLRAAATVHHAMAELERTCPSSILSGAATPPETTSVAAVIHLSQRMFNAAEAVAVIDSAAAASNTTARHVEADVSAVSNVAAVLYNAADALRNVSLALRSTSIAVCNVDTAWYNAAVAINIASAAVHEASPARAVFGAAVPLLDVTFTVLANSPADLSPAIRTSFDGAGDQ